MSLRDDLIEAGVAEYESLMESDAEGADWNTEEYVMHILDAVLDMLADRADEWEKTAEVRNALGDVRRDFDVDWLIAVLRSTEGET